MLEKRWRGWSGVAAALVLACAACSTGPAGKVGSVGAPRWAGRTGPITVGEHCVDRLDLDGYAEAFREVRGPDWDGADMSVAAVMGEQTRLWLFGDTFTGEMDDDGQILDPWALHHNSMVIQRGKCFEFHMGVVDGVIGELIPDPAQRRRFWPGGAYPIMERGRIAEVRVLTTIGHKPKGADGSFSVRFVGAAVLRMSWPDLEVLSRTTLGMPEEMVIHHLVSGDDEWRYLYAHYVTATPAQFVARARDADLLRGRLEWWDGERWSTDAAEAEPMEFLDDGEPEEGPWSPVYVVADGRGYVASATRLQLMTDDVTAWWAENPWGPWRTANPDEGQVMTMPIDSESYRYGAHYEVLPGVGPTIIWNHHPGYREIPENAYEFGPRFVEPEALITPWSPVRTG